MPLVHLPVQSGSDKVLELMNRKHTIRKYLEIYYKLKEINSSVQFSSDFIIAYPGENENDFNDTLKLIKKVKFIKSTLGGCIVEKQNNFILISKELKVEKMSYHPQK